MPEPSEIIVKYFNERFLGNINDGSFALGCIAGYRAEELHNAADARFSDTREGLVQSKMTPPDDGFVERLDLPDGGRLTGVHFGGLKIAVEVVEELNDYCFCASLGQYSRDHHIAMLNGITAGDINYSGNTDLTHYAVISGRAFFDAVCEAAQLHHTWKPERPLSSCIFAHPVLYADTAEHIKLQRNTDATRKKDRSDYDRTVFIKPRNFAVEKEWRLVVRPRAPKCIPASERKPMILQSERLRNSILSTGRI